MRTLEIRSAAANAKSNLSGSGAHTGARPDTASTAAARAALAGESRQPCKLRMRVAQVKAELIRQRETELLMPAAGHGASEVLRLLRPVTETLASTCVPPAIAEFSQSLSKPVAALAAVTAFNTGQSVSVTAPVSVIASELIGMSCTIGSSGEVCGTPA